MPIPLPPAPRIAVAGPAPAPGPAQPSATTTGSPAGRPWRQQGQALQEGQPWVMKRNCSISPAQMLSVYGSLCAVSLLIGVAFLSLGAPLVLAFGVLELLLVGLALLVFARRVGDRETLRLQGLWLDVELVQAGSVRRERFNAEWLRVEPAAGQRSLIELGAQGHHIHIGRFVRPELRQALARELRLAVRRARLGLGSAPLTNL